MENPISQPILQAYSTAEVTEVEASTPSLPWQVQQLVVKLEMSSYFEEKYG